ncbi:MAG: response regulator [Candidatus Anammoxibacter sp.]
MQATNILIIEDSPEDYETTVRAFKKAGFVNLIYHCSDGDEALDYLFRRGDFADPEKSPRPAIILLDLNLPGTDGREVLVEIKKDSDLRKIPVVVLTTSSDERDIEQCYASGANSYIQKPVDLDGFVEAIAKLKDFWFKICILPKEEPYPCNGPCDGAGD